MSNLVILLKNFCLSHRQCLINNDKFSNIKPISLFRYFLSDNIEPYLRRWDNPKQKSSHVSENQEKCYGILGFKPSPSEIRLIESMIDYGTFTLLVNDVEGLNFHNACFALSRREKWPKIALHLCHQTVLGVWVETNSNF